MLVTRIALSLSVVLLVSNADAQPALLERLPPARLDVVAPSARVTGAPGALTLREIRCRTVAPPDLRRRIVDVAVQEWGFFGFSVVDQIADDETDPNDDGSRARRRRRLVDPLEAARVASSIAGYWSVTPEGSWIVARQNQAWNDADGLAARWQYPWSAAFVSWVMCEGGLGSAAAFQRAAAHHTYIDQAIRARDARLPQAAFVAYDAGEVAVEPGDLLCSARRPAYRTLAERRAQMGTGARTHCDVVVKVDAAGRRILAIGGNVRGAVSLKVLPLAERRGPARFAHLKLRAGSIEGDALEGSPTMQALACARVRVPAQFAAASVTIPRPASC